MRPFFSLILSCTLLSCSGQTPTLPEESPWITYYVNANVDNAEEDYSVAITDHWKAYLENPRHYGQPNDYWSSTIYERPDFAYVNLLFYLYNARRAQRPIQCNILGVQPKEEGIYQLKTMYSEVDDSTGQLSLSYIASVFAREDGEGYSFFGATEYYQGRYEVRQVDSIKYLIHPEHDFQEEEAKKMAAYNQEVAKKFNTAPLSFDYVVANNTNDLAILYGLEFSPYSMNAVPTGGLADTRNKVLYAGNNSAYYPHELVHLYTFAGFGRQHHAWVDEGIAAFLGGSTGYYIEWHWQKLKAFLADDPDYALDDLKALETDIPNGEYTTDFRYAIGGYLMYLIHEKEGMQGLFDALSSGRDEEAYFALLQDKLGVDREGFGAFIRQEMKALPRMSAEKMTNLKY